MKITPQFMHFTSLVHHGHDIGCKPCLPLLAPVATLEDFFFREVARVHEVISDPFVEVEAPVCEGVC